MNLRLCVALLSVLWFSLTSSVSLAQDKADVGSLKVIFFDVNETLLDLEHMKSSVGQALKGRQDLMTLWFSRMLHYSLVSVAIDQYQDFGSIGVNALLMVAQENGITLTHDEAKKAIVGPLLSLPPHSDVVKGLKRLKALKGIKLVTFTNSTLKGVEIQIKNAKLTGLFTSSLSTDEIKTYKPFLKSYEWALAKMKVKPEESLMVAAHGWDIAGAKAAGMRTAFIARPGQSIYSPSGQPDFIVKDLQDLAALLTP